MSHQQDWSAFGAGVLFSLGLERVTSAYWLDQQLGLSAPLLAGVTLLIASVVAFTQYAVHRRRR